MPLRLARQGPVGLMQLLLGGLLLGVLAFGLAVCWLAVATAVRGRLIESIRRE